MSRTTRVVPAAGFWAAVDDWAAEVVEPVRLLAWWRSRCRLVTTGGPFLDVVDAADGSPLPGRPLRNPIAARGTALPDDEAVVAALAEQGLAFRRVDTARRYVWRGPAFAPVVLEVHTADGRAILEAWWEDVWAAWPTIGLGRESTRRAPDRRATAGAQISRLLEALDQPPLGRAGGAGPP